MFEVEPILWLQGFASPALTAMMQLVSLLGREWFYALVVLVVGFGLRLRPMLGVLLALLLAGLCTHAIKRELGLPRPVQVDARVLHKGGANTRWLVRHGGAADAFALPTPAAIAAARAVPQPDFGFISGHAAAATARKRVSVRRDDVGERQVAGEHGVHDAEVDLDCKFERIGAHPLDPVATGNDGLQHPRVVQGSPNSFALGVEQISAAELHASEPFHAAFSHHSAQNSDAATFDQLCGDPCAIN